MSHFLSTLNMSSLEARMEGIFVLYHGRAYYEAFRATWPEFFLDNPQAVCQCLTASVSPL
jgi:hypothetical protein